MRYKDDNEQGRSMIEMMGYMAVAMAFVVSVGNLVAHTMEEYKYSKAYVQLTDLATGVVRAAAIDADYKEVVDGINDGVSQYTKIIPASFRRKGANIYHAFGGDVDISLPPADADLNLGEAVSSDEETAHSDKFAITFNGLTRRQCIEMAMKDWQNNKNIDLYAIVINSNNYWYWPAYTTYTDDNTLPVTRVDVTGTDDSDLGQCNRDTDNVIMWIFN